MRCDFFDLSDMFDSFDALDIYEATQPLQSHIKRVERFPSETQLCMYTYVEGRRVVILHTAYLYGIRVGGLARRLGRIKQSPRVNAILYAGERK